MSTEGAEPLPTEPPKKRSKWPYWVGSISFAIVGVITIGSLTKIGVHSVVELCATHANGGACNSPTHRLFSPPHQDFLVIDPGGFGTNQITETFLEGNNSSGWRTLWIQHVNVTPSFNVSWVPAAAVENALLTFSPGHYEVIAEVGTTILGSWTFSVSNLQRAASGA